MEMLVAGDPGIFFVMWLKEANENAHKLKQSIQFNLRMKYCFMIDVIISIPC